VIMDPGEKKERAPKKSVHAPISQKGRNKFTHGTAGKGGGGGEDGNFL